MLLHFIFVIKEKDLGQRDKEYEYVKKMAQFFQVWIKTKFSLDFEIDFNPSTGTGDTSTIDLSSGSTDLDLFLDNLVEDVDLNQNIKFIISKRSFKKLLGSTPKFTISLNCSIDFFCCFKS